MARRAAVYVGNDECGFGTGLQELMSRCGTELDLIGKPDVFGYDGNLTNCAAAARVDRLLAAAQRRWLLSRRLRSWLARWVRIVELGVRYRVLIFGSGRTVSSQRTELIFYRIIRCRIVAVFFGSDARPPFLNGAHFSALSKTATREQRLVEQLQRCELANRYADVIIATLGIVHYFTRDVVDRDAIGWPAAGRGFLNGYNQAVEQGRPVRILHAPSNTEAKGTRLIQKCIDNLRAQGHRIDFRVLTGVANSEVLSGLEWCDFAVNQLWADLGSGVFAQEAMRGGRPVIVGSYQAEWLRDRYAKLGQPLPILVEPEAVSETMERLVSSSDALNESRRDAERVAGKLNNPEEIGRLAREWTGLLLDGAVASFGLVPQHVETLFFGFASRERVVRMIDVYVEQFGLDGLGLDEIRQRQLRSMRSSRLV